MDFYTHEELARIVSRSAILLGISVDAGGAKQIAARSRGTPRIANRLLRRTRDYAEELADSIVTDDVACNALDMLDVDHLGLDKMDRMLLVTLIDKFSGGPVGLETLAAAINEAKDTIEDVYEPYLLQEGLLLRTPRGREATLRAYQHLGRAPTRRSPSGVRQASLFEESE